MVKLRGPGIPSVPLGLKMQAPAAEEFSIDLQCRQRQCNLPCNRVCQHLSEYARGSYRWGHLGLQLRSWLQ